MAKKNLEREIIKGDEKEEGFLRDASSEISFKNIEDAINGVKEECKKYIRTDYSLADKKRFPRKLKKNVSEVDIWLIIHPGYKRSCWVISDEGNRFVDPSMKAIVFYIPAGCKYLIMSVTEIFYTIMSSLKK